MNRRASGFVLGWLSTLVVTVAGVADDRGRALEIEGMRVSWRAIEGGIEVELVAETAGWVAIGFNADDDIVGSDLFMAAVQGGRGVAEHHFVTAPGLHPNVEALGRRSAIRSAEVERDGRRTVARLVLDAGRVEAPLSAGTQLVMIAAWSVAPEFDHHSRVRRHIRVTL